MAMAKGYRLSQLTRRWQTRCLSGDVNAWLAYKELLRRRGWLTAALGVCLHLEALRSTLKES